MTPFGRWAFGCGVALLLAAQVAATPASPTATNNGAIWAGGTEGSTVDWRVDRLDVTRAGKPVLSFGAVAAREWSAVRELADDQALMLAKTYAVLSDVGPWLSVQEGSFCDCGGAHPTAVQRFRAYDLRESRPDRSAPADLARIFPADAILAALLHNDAVASVLKDAGAESPRTLPDLLQALAFKTIKVGDCSYLFDDALLSSFAFHRIAGDKVAVRLGLPHAAEVCRGELTQIEILVPVPEALRAPLRAAEGGVEGLLIEKAEGMDAGRTTTFTFSYEPGQGRK